MPTFALIGFDRFPHDKALREDIREAHSAYVIANRENIQLAGAMVDDQGVQCGTIYVFEAPDADWVRNWASLEPFCAGGIYESLIIRQIQPGAFWTLGATPNP